ncbi:von Willebrand factor type A domain-containing protein [Frankia sp. EI5c]|uniref:vWA domain-containing protein n=1 Tax=Frankia sp. EI5c TaxID=683316 RepID=UPI0007C3B8A0|nr:vWA domain-containing protein [Frankia sp. EI5c]OAA29597.1 von Willebrand factor type A domain-containing protein [Frankia sp. EI5c]
MWIVLLDHSASMTGPFGTDSTRARFGRRHGGRARAHRAGQRPSGGRQPGEPGRARAERDPRAAARGRGKLDATVESVSNTLAELPPGLRTVLVGFTDSADVVYEGRAGDRAAFERTLRTAGPASGGADVAAALERARAHLAGLAERPPFVRLLLVTDNLAAPGDLLQAAYDCARSGIIVDVVVLGDSPQVAELAAVIVDVTGGDWQAAPGEGDLAPAISAAGRRAARQVLQANDDPDDPDDPDDAKLAPLAATVTATATTTGAGAEAATATAPPPATRRAWATPPAPSAPAPASVPAPATVPAPASVPAPATVPAHTGPPAPAPVRAPGAPGAGEASAAAKPAGQGPVEPGRTAHRRVDVAFPVFTLVPTVANSDVERIGESLRTIVPFLEDLTGLRYYPPPTYVTDDTTVTRLRRTCEPDARFLADELSGEVPPGVLDDEEEALAERVREILVVFGTHVLDVGPDTDLIHVRREAMGGFVRNVRRCLAGRPTRLDGAAAPPGFPDPPVIWRQRCAEDFPSFAGLYCELVVRYADRHIRARSSNRIDPEVRARLVAELGPRAAAAIERSVGGVVVEPPIDLDFRARLGAALDELRALVTSREQVTSDYLSSGANTFGVFRFSGGAGRFGRSGMLVPTSAPAVLIGAGALSKTAAALRGDASLDEPIWERAAEFCELALLHEHAHAAIATGLDEHGARAAAVGSSVWAAGSGLNEALVTWAQAHFYRDNQRLYRECAQYIRSGPRRSWPYRGAEALEGLYRREGIEAVRGFVRLLRASPEAAQAEFDRLPESG